jgi:hypothetical protein
MTACQIGVTTVARGSLRLNSCLAHAQHACSWQSAHRTFQGRDTILRKVFSPTPD